MNPKFPPGTLVQIIKHHSRSDIVGKKFFVTDFKYAELLNRSNGKTIPASMCYRAPYKSLIRTNKDIWIPEEYLREVDMDDGFEFEEDWSVWTPIVSEVPDYGYANA